MQAVKPRQRKAPAAAESAAAAQTTEDDTKPKYRPQTTKGGKSDRAAGAKDQESNVQGGRGRRPQTAAADDDDGNTRGANRGRNQRGGAQRGTAARTTTRTNDPDSWIHKFHNMDRPKFENVEVTPDFEIPPMPSKEERLKEPKKEDLDSDLKAIDQKINAQKKEREAIIKKKKEIREGGFTTGNTTRKQELNVQIAKVKKVRELKTEQ